MSDLSITDLLFAYGAWVNDDQTSLECKSPEQLSALVVIFRLIYFVIFFTDK